MRVCRLQVHQWCFVLCNVMLFHALLFGSDFIEEFLLPTSPAAYTDRSVLELRERARKLDLSQPSANASRRLYPVSAAACLPHQNLLLILTLVFSSPGNASQREAIRKSWANQTTVRTGVAVRTLFFVVASAQSVEEKEMLEEAYLHGDMVVLGEGGVARGGAVSERMHWEQMKLALRWVLLYCSQAWFVVVVETDSAFLNVPALASYLLGTGTRPDDDLYLGRVIHKASPERDPKRPNYLPPHLYPDRLLPDYCSGPTYLMSQDVVRKVYVASEDVTLPLPSSVLIGLCARRAGVVATPSIRFSGEQHLRYSACCYNFLFSIAGIEPEKMDMVWRDLGSGHGRRCGVLETYYSLVACKTMTYLDKLNFLNINNSGTQE
ncbi:putative UDP-GlcNAc:betaGal beta-1,3-N-acetylglucosaminyltransferase LOC100288842 [Chanos chanos]|uniref:Hexosyltransferase n=1 Tax=Chanos chanos TaxID=29144 RepID=A0A6J2UXH5_CHACN|nr:putative UDP-GlcNAc:betaGal beta-1,3-N-acetylglucosaminyltransferase LOC100288842 [Chanos chanos]